MERIVFTLLIATSACCWCEKYVFVEQKENWPDAREHCMNHYTDFLALTNEEEEQVFKKFVNKDSAKAGWIGLYWDQPSNKWKWSGGDYITYHNELDLPDNLVGTVLERIAENVFWTSSAWEWKPGDHSHEFFCMNLEPVEEEKTWEDALEHCREKNTNLTSLLSLTESLMAQREIQSIDYSEQVWIGLRYLGDSWMWVNGDPVAYEAWPEGDQGHMCPMLRRCVALTKQRVWESRDCQEKHSFICA